MRHDYVPVQSRCCATLAHAGVRRRRVLTTWKTKRPTSRVRPALLGAQFQVERTCEQPQRPPLSHVKTATCLQCRGRSSLNWMWRRAVAAVAAVAVTFPQGTRGQDIATAEWEHEPCEHSAYRQRITELEAELAMYRQASTAGQVVCTLGGEHAQLVGGEGTYTISSNV